jgi:type IV pilus assembly protein PilB
LLTNKKITPEKFKTLEQQSENEKKPLKDVVVADNIASEQELAKMYGILVGVPYAEFNAKDIAKDILKKIPEHIAKQYRMILFDIEKESQAYLVAMEDPEDIQAVDTLQKIFGTTNIRPYIATHSNISVAIEQYRENIGSELTKVVSDEEAEAAADEELKEEDIAEDSPIAQTVNLIIEYAIHSGASDIHIEPREQYVSVRYRGQPAAA